MPTSILNITESQEFTAIRAFLLSITGLPSTSVIQGQINRVPEPTADDFIVFWPLSQERLGTNDTTYDDSSCVASIVGSVLTATSVNGTLLPGIALFDVGSLLAANTVLGTQLTGSLGGTGTYSVSPSQTFVSGTINAGKRNDKVAVNWHIQLDVHGQNSGNLTRIIETLFRSDYGSDSIISSGYDITPLYCEDPNQIPFNNAEQQVENNWSITTCIQLNPIVTSSQQFAAEVHVDTIEVKTHYPL